ncbi:nucleotide-binding protein [Mycobacteroides chelonae]|nr:nucleotide-binding protein [Mycobacteroides chelonae]
MHWLFNEAISGNKRPALSVEGVARSVDWREQELTTDEVDGASVWLKNNGLIEGLEAWGGGVVRPSLTGQGEALVESGRTVRDFVGVLGTPGHVDEPATGEDKSVSAAVFLVHGRNSSAKFEVARWLEQSLTADIIILDEQANRGQTIIEKFQAHADAAKFAVVLLTSDDIGGTSDSELHPRARQNVIFEMGYFFGKLGRDRVAVLNDGVEHPSDFAGVGYIPFSGNWKEALSRELRAVNFVVNPT